MGQPARLLKGSSHALCAAFGRYLGNPVILRPDYRNRRRPQRGKVRHFAPGGFLDVCSPPLHNLRRQ